MKSYQNLDDNPGTTRGTKFSVLQKKSSSLNWSTVVVYRWPTHMHIRVLHRVFQVIELQACHRVVAPSRRDQDRERVLVLLHLLALLHWPLPPLWGSWIPAESPFRLSLNPICSACALMLRSRPRILVPLEILKWAPAMSWLQSEGKTYPYPYF